MFYSYYEIKEMINMQYQDTLKRSAEDRLVNRCRCSRRGHSILFSLIRRGRGLWNGKK